MGDTKEIVFGPTELVRKPDAFRGFLGKSGKEFAPGSERLFAEVFPFQRFRCFCIIGGVNEERPFSSSAAISPSRIARWAGNFFKASSS